MREKLHALVRRAAEAAESFARKRGPRVGEYQRKLQEPFGKGEVCCANCGSTKMPGKNWGKVLARPAPPGIIGVAGTGKTVAR